MIKASDINEEDFNDRFKLLLDRFVARRLGSDPDMIIRARHYLLQQRESGRPEWNWWIDEWLEILNRPVEEIRRDITKTTDKWKQLRNVSPLGLVSGLDFFQDIAWRRRAIRKVKAGLVMVRNSQHERRRTEVDCGGTPNPR